MLIGKNWKIESDSYDVILSKKHGTSWVDIGYFATVENALHELVNQGVRDSALKDLKAIVKAITDLQDMIKAGSFNAFVKARRASKGKTGNSIPSKGRRGLKTEDGK